MVEWFRGFIVKRFSILVPKLNCRFSLREATASRFVREQAFARHRSASQACTEDTLPAQF